MKRFLPAVIWSLVILLLSILPGSSLPKVGWKSFLEFDKIAHAGVYFVLVVITAMSLKASIKARLVKNLALVVLVCSLYGILLEVIQYIFLSDRFFEIPDIIANISGSILGSIIVYLILKRKAYES